MSTKFTNLAKFMVLNIISLSASQSSKPEMLEYGGAPFFICRVFYQFVSSLVFFIGYFFGGALLKNFSSCYGRLPRHCIRWKLNLWHKYTNTEIHKNHRKYLAAQNDKFTEEEMHNYRMAVTEREVIIDQRWSQRFINNRTNGWTNNWSTIKQTIEPMVEPMVEPKIKPSLTFRKKDWTGYILRKSGGQCKKYWGDHRSTIEPMVEPTMKPTIDQRSSQWYSQ